MLLPHERIASIQRIARAITIAGLLGTVTNVVARQLDAQGYSTNANVRDRGRGVETWVLLSGTIGGVSGMHQLESRLVAGGFRVVTIDVYGMFVDSADVSFAAMARRVDAVLQQLHVDRAHVVGHAHGGGVALRLASSFPSRVTALDLLDVGALPSNRTATMSGAISLAPMVSRMPGGKTFIRTRLVEGIRENSGDAKWFDVATERAYTQPVLDNVKRAVAMAERLGQAQETESVASLIARVHVPVTVILGSAPHASAPGADQITALAPLGSQLRVIRLRGVGHFPHEEAPDQVMRTLIVQLVSAGTEIKQ